MKRFLILTATFNFYLNYRIYYFCFVLIIEIFIYKKWDNTNKKNITIITITMPKANNPNNKFKQTMREEKHHWVGW